MFENILLVRLLGRIKRYFETAGKWIKKSLNVLLQKKCPKKSLIFMRLKFYLLYAFNASFKIWTDLIKSSFFRTYAIRTSSKPTFGVE